jgi:spore coat protein A
MEELTRRQLLQISAAAGLGVVTPLRLPGPADALAPPRGSLHPLSIRKYVTPLVIPPQMPFTSRGRADYYEIAVRQFGRRSCPAADRRPPCGATGR